MITGPKALCVASLPFLLLSEPAARAQDGQFATRLPAEVLATDLPESGQSTLEEVLRSQSGSQIVDTPSFFLTPALVLQTPIESDQALGLLLDDQYWELSREGNGLDWVRRESDAIDLAFSNHRSSMREGSGCELIDPPETVTVLLSLAENYSPTELDPADARHKLNHALDEALCRGPGPGQCFGPRVDILVEELHWSPATDKGLTHNHNLFDQYVKNHPAPGTFDIAVGVYSAKFTANSFCGLAPIPASPQSRSATVIFNCKAHANQAERTVAHEIAHLLGAWHATGNSSQPPVPFAQPTSSGPFRSLVWPNPSSWTISDGAHALNDLNSDTNRDNACAMAMLAAQTAALSDVQPP